MRRLKRLREATTPDAADRMAEGKRLFLAANGNMSRVVEVEKLFCQAVPLTPADADALAYLGWSLDTQGRWSEAIPLFNCALQLDPQ